MRGWTSTPADPRRVATNEAPHCGAFSLGRACSLFSDSPVRLAASPGSGLAHASARPRMLHRTHDLRPWRVAMAAVRWRRHLRDGFSSRMAVGGVCSRRSTVRLAGDRPNPHELRAKPLAAHGPPTSMKSRYPHERIRFNPFGRV